MFILLFYLSAFANDPSVQNHNMHVLYLSDANQSGSEVELLLDISEITEEVSTLETDYAASFQSVKAKSVVTSVKDISEEKKTTVLAFDDSILMQKGRPLMIAAAKEYLRSLSVSQKKDHTIDIVLGARKTKVFAADLSPKEAIQTLDALPKPNQKNTDLRYLLTDAIEEVKTRNNARNGGMRQIILFSDGEEKSGFSTYDASMLIKKARLEGVQIHFLFINRHFQKKPETIATIKRFQSISENTGGINVIENVVGGQGSLDIGAQRIASKIGKLRRAMLSICEVQQTGHHTLKIQYDTLDYAWIEHNIKSDLALNKDCPCVPICLGGESCSGGKCTSTDNIRHNADNFDFSNFLKIFREQDSDPWWLILIPLWPLLLLFLFRKKKSSKYPSATPILANLEEADQPAQSDLGLVSEPSSYQMVLHIYKGTSEHKTLLEEMTLMHKEAILEGIDVEPSPILQNDVMINHHLRFFLNDDRSIEIQDLASRSGVIIENKTRKEWRKMNAYERLFFDFEKDILILFDGNGETTEEVWVELFFSEKKAKN